MSEHTANQLISRDQNFKEECGGSVVEYTALDRMLENHCTRTAQSSQVGRSRWVQRIVYLANKKVMFGQYFTSENIHC